MTRRLTPRHLRTRLGLDAGQAAGRYEQTDHRSRGGEAFDSNRRSPGGALTVSGMVERPGRLGHHVLRSLAGSDRLSDFDARSVGIADLLSEIRLDADANLIMWRGIDGAQIATPVAHLLGDVGSMLVLGGVDLTSRPRWSAPVTLRSACLPNGRDIEVVAATAMTFMEFVGGAR